MDRQVLYANGHYFVVTVERDDDHDRSVFDGFAVVTGTGTALRYEPTIDAARNWLDKRLLEEARAEVPRPMKTSPRRRH